MSLASQARKTAEVTNNTLSFDEMHLLIKWIQATAEEGKYSAKLTAYGFKNVAELVLQKPTYNTADPFGKLTRTSLSDLTTKQKEIVRYLKLNGFTCELEPHQLNVSWEDATE